MITTKNGFITRIECLDVDAKKSKAELRAENATKLSSLLKLATGAVSKDFGSPALKGVTFLKAEFGDNHTITGPCSLILWCTPYTGFHVTVYPSEESGSSHVHHISLYEANPIAGSAGFPPENRMSW